MIAAIITKAYAQKFNCPACKEYLANKKLNPKSNEKFIIIFVKLDEQLNTLLADIEAWEKESLYHTCLLRYVHPLDLNMYQDAELLKVWNKSLTPFGKN